nr:hypothetical protein [Tanacetum cinerariifolium]
MVGSDIDGYTARFHESARLVLYMVNLESQRVNHYIRGFALKIKLHVTSSKPATIQGVMSMANRLTMDGIKDGFFKEKENARNKKRSNDQNKNQGVAEAPQDPNIVTGTFSLNDHFAIVLFDSGVDYRFDMIVGMDWLSKPKAKIVCYEKIIQIPLSNRDILEVHGERPEGNLKQLKTMKGNEPKLEDIPVGMDDFVVYCDASNQGFACVLIHMNKAERDRQKRYVDNRRNLLEFSVDDIVLLKVSPRKGMKCLVDVNMHVPLEEVKIDENLHFVEEPMEFMDHAVKKLKRSQIVIVKVRWNSQRGPKFTWKREDEMKRKYSQLFVRLRLRTSN